MRAHIRRLLAFLMALALGCARERPTPGSSDGVASSGAAAAAPHPVESCLEGDSVVLSDVEVDTVETGDASGVQITLRRLAGGWRGEAREAAGELGGAVPIARVALSAPDSVALDMPHMANAPDTSIFRGRVICDSLWGRQITYRASPPRHVVYRRVR